MKCIVAPTVRLFSRQDRSWWNFLSHIARVSRGHEPGATSLSEDYCMRLLQSCWNRQHFGVFEFWPSEYVGPTDEWRYSDTPPPFTTSDRCYSYDTLAHGCDETWDDLCAHWMDPNDVLPIDKAYPCFYITCSRVALAQLTRYRWWFSFNVESQRYVDYVKHEYSYYLPPKLGPAAEATVEATVLSGYAKYCYLRAQGVPPEDARYVLSTATTTRLVMTAPRERWKHFLRQRLDGSTGKPQGEIHEIAKQIKEAIA